LTISLVRCGHRAADETLHDLGELVDAEWLGEHMHVADALELTGAFTQGGHVGRADDDRDVDEAPVGARKGDDLPARRAGEQQVDDHKIRSGFDEIVDAGRRLAEGRDVVPSVVVQDGGHELEELGVVVQDRDARTASGHSICSVWGSAEYSRARARRPKPKVVDRVAAA
jgi:hypothetical protein